MRYGLIYARDGITVGAAMRGMELGQRSKMPTLTNLWHIVRPVPAMGRCNKTTPCHYHSIDAI